MKRNGPEAELIEPLHQEKDLAVDFPVVALGASAGGLASLEAVFESLPDNLGATYIVLQHLSSDFKSHMTELLGRVTSLPVHQATDRIALEPDHVYVIPPKKEMILSAGRLLLTDKDPRNAPSLPIDTFFRSMANELGRRSVGVILSGTGSDGARGVREIKEAGGFVIAQDPQDAEFNGMPLSAIGTGVVDAVMNARDVSGELIRIVPLMCEHRGKPRDEPELDRGLQRVLQMLEAHHEVDFSYYKPTTLARRTRRRMELCGEVSVERYAARLEHDAEEVGRLFHDLLIGVTEFFRDPDAFASMAEAAKALFTPENTEVRAWVAGCATGEEAYSVAMVLDELRRAHDWGGRIRVFATDMHQEALKQASLGIYPAAALAALTEERRRRYFTASDGQLRITETLRELVIFARHNLLTDAPFTQLDLICCRNVLIYFQPDMQSRLLALFHFGLRTGGLLFLGPSETLGKLQEEFEAIDIEARVFSKRRDLRLMSHPGFSRPQFPLRRRVPTAVMPTIERNGAEVYEALLERFMPASFLVNESQHLLHSFAGAERYLRFRGGKLSTTLPDLLDGRMRTAVSGLLERFRQEPDRVHSVRLAEGGDKPRSLNIRASAVPLPQGQMGVLLEIHELVPAPAQGVDVPDVDSGTVVSEYVESLERDLELARSQLQTTVEELEAANEELQATNEELVASNEELQSTNEELRSVNEELNSVNVDHQKKIGELTEVTEDLENLLHTINVGVLFLDDDMLIRRVNHRMGELLHILPQDIGRSFEHFKNNLHAPSVFETAQRVIETGRGEQQEIRTPNHQALLLTVLPYASSGNSAKGVVLTVVDVTSWKAAESEAARLSAIVRNARDAIISKGLDGRITSWNRGAERLYGYSEAEAIGRHVRLIVPDERAGEIDRILAETREGREVPPFETLRIAKDGSRRHVLLSVAPIRSDSGEITGGSVIALDITARRSAEDRAEMAVAQRDRFLAMLSHELRNPLMALASANELLGRPHNGEAEVKRARDIISRQVTQMSRLLEDTLDASRMRHDRIEVHRKSIDLCKVAEDAMDATRPRAALAGVTLELHVPDEAVYVKADSARMQQVIVNLTQNAINHSESGTRVRVDLRVTGGKAVISVRDEGAGLEKALLTQVFEPFFQASRRSKDGMGLGLSLARAIVLAHHGTIEARSEGLGRGSQFLVRLPLAQSGEASDTGEFVTVAAAGRTSVVLIDDDDASRESVGILLRDAGYEVFEANNGVDGLKLIEEVAPSVAVVDVGLPDISGLEVTRRVREHFGSKQIRLVVLTGFGSQADREAAVEAGCDMHLVKPIDFATLERVIAYQAAR